MIKPTLLKPLDYFKRQTDRRFVGLRVDPSPPSMLGRNELKEADVLFCCGSRRLLSWRLISYGSSGNYVHTAIYLGDGKVAESTTNGVQEADLAHVVDRYAYIAVARCPGVSDIPDLQSKVLMFCRRHIDSMTRYSFVGAALSPMLELVELIRLRFSARSIGVRSSRNANRTFCSQFVLDAFIAGGYIPEDYSGNGARSPTALAEDNWLELKGYLSRSQRIDSLLRKDFFWTGGG